MASVRIWFIRHGEVDEAHIGRFIGTQDAPLSALGCHQAAAVAALLEDAPVDAVLSSPRTRARDTARPFAHAAGLAVEVRPRIAEMDFGSWEGLTWQEIEARDAAYAKRWQADPAAVACPGGHTAAAFAAGVAQELEEVAQEFAGRTVAMFAHAGVNRAILAAILERPYMEMFRFAQDYGCVNAAQAGQDAQVALVNLVPGPRSQHPSW